MAGKAVSIYDIARIAGVSTATVSKVLNGKGSISQKTRERVMAIAHEQGYVPSFAARTLAQSETRTVGLIVPDISNEFFSAIVLRMETLLYDAGYTCYICDSHNDEEREASYLSSLVQRQVDGLVLVNGRHHPSFGQLPKHLPVVAVDPAASISWQRLVYVYNDWHAMISDATTVLMEAGCVHVGVLANTNDLVRSTGEDFEGFFLDPFRDTLATHGIRLDRNLLLLGSRGQESRIDAREQVGACLDDGFELDGLVCLGDRLALGACEALRERGLVVGEDVLIISTDNSYSAETAVPPLSSIDRHTDQLAEEGVKALLAMMAGQESEEHVAAIPHTIVERASTRGHRQGL